MTSPVAVIGLVWDGFDLQREDLDIYFEVTEGLDDLPEVRGSDQVIPFRHGRLWQPHMADHRPVVAVGWVTRPSASLASAYRAYIDALKARLDPTGPPRLLVATLEDGTKRWINAVPRDLIGGPAMGSDFRPFSIAWGAPDPYWYSAYGTLSLDDGVEMDDDELMDAGGEIVVVPPTTQVTFTNPGTATVERIRVRFVGASTGSVGIENLSTPTVVGFTLAQTLLGGQRITVNNYRRTARRDLGAGQGNVRGSMTLHAGNQHGEYLRLVPGSNTLRVIGAPAECRITYFPTWL